MNKFKVGDEVIFVGDPNKHIDNDTLSLFKTNRTLLTISEIDAVGDYLVVNYRWAFQEDELKFVSSMETVTNNIIGSMICDKETQAHSHILTWDGNISDLCGYETTANYVTRSYVDEKINELKVKEKNCMKILEIYRREAEEKIENDYDNLVNKIIEEDKVQKLIEETENQINVILDKDENEAISLGFKHLLEQKSKDKISETLTEKHNQMKQLDIMLEKVAARLEICDDDEFSKVEVLKLYNILDDDGKIAEYKIEKKGKK